MKFQIPQLLRIEHQQLHEELVEATKAKGRTGEAAREVAALLHPHFVKEEAYALPPLGLMKPLAEGKFSPEMAKVLDLTDQLQAQFSQMLQEHHEITLALQKLALAARDERQPKFEQLARKIILHAQTEEEVMYPASLLVGELVKARLKG